MRPPLRPSPPDIMGPLALAAALSPMILFALAVSLAALVGLFRG